MERQEYDAKDGAPFAKQVTEHTGINTQYSVLKITVSYRAR